MSDAERYGDSPKSFRDQVASCVELEQLIVVLENTTTPEAVIEILRDFNKGNIDHLGPRLRGIGDEGVREKVRELLVAKSFETAQSPEDFMSVFDALTLYGVKYVPGSGDQRYDINIVTEAARKFFADSESVNLPRWANMRINAERIRNT